MTLDKSDDVSKNVSRTFEDQRRQIQAVRDRPGKNDQTVEYQKEQWVSLKSSEAKDIEMPKALRCHLKLKTREPVTLLEFRQVISEKCNVVVRVTSDAIAVANGAMPAANTGIAPGVGQPAMQASVMQEKLIDLNFNADLQPVLDSVTARMGLSWKPENGGIKIFNVDTETFYLNALASDTTMRSEMFSGTTMINGASGAGAVGGGTAAGSTGSTSGGVGGTSGTNQSTAVALKTAIWTDVQKVLESMATDKKNVATSPSTGAITVTDTADVLARVRSYIKRENENLTKQVLFNIKVVSVTTNSKDNFAVSWSAVYQTLSQKYGFKLVGGTGAGEGSTSGSFSILQNSGSPWAGTTAILDALNEQGDARIVREPTTTALNLRSVGVQVAKQNGFIVGSQATTTAQVGTTTALQAGMITTGFNMSLFPYVMQDNRMLLQFNINLSSLDNLRTVRNGDSIAELPEIGQPINSAQNVRLSPGDTLMLTGFDQEDQATTQSGTFTPKNFLLGGGAKTNQMRTSLVVLITPVILD